MGNKGCKPVVPYDEVIETASQATLERFEEEFRRSTGADDLAGRIDREQFLETIGRPFSSWGEKVVDRLFRVLDSDGSKQINFQEFVCAAFVFHSGSREQQLRLIFQMFDLDHDDLVSRKEFQKMMEAVILRGREIEVDVPKDRSGDQMETITMEALSDLSSGMAEMAIDAFDADGDGKLNFREWQEFAEQDELVLEFLETMGTVLPDT